MKGVETKQYINHNAIIDVAVTKITFWDTFQHIKNITVETLCWRKPYCQDVYIGKLPKEVLLWLSG